MKHSVSVLFLSLWLAGGWVHAQPASSEGVRESTDPGRAAEVERRAQEISGQRGTSPDASGSSETGVDARPQQQSSPRSSQRRSESLESEGASGTASTQEMPPEQEGAAGASGTERTAPQHPGGMMQGPYEMGPHHMGPEGRTDSGIDSSGGSAGDTEGTEYGSPPNMPSTSPSESPGTSGGSGQSDEVYIPPIIPEPGTEGGTSGTTITPGTSGDASDTESGGASGTSGSSSPGVTPEAPPYNDTLETPRLPSQ